MSENPPSRSKREIRGEHAVGYGRPPEDTRFKPGQCGNPKGRPKKLSTLKEEIDRELDAKVTVQEGGRTKRLSKRNIGARRFADDVAKGKPGSLQQLIKLEQSPLSIRSGRDPNASAADLPAQSFDQTDRAIVAHFAAMVRSGAIVPDMDYPPDDGKDAVTAKRPLPDNEALSSEWAEPPSPTSH